MSVAGIKNHFASWREWELNPIVVKELRQAVRSWAITGMLLLFLVVLFLISLGFLAFQSFDVDSNMQLGGTMFSWFIPILAIASILFIPLYIAIRVSAERQENNPDLLYVSTLSPARIIRGKFLCGVYMAVLFFSACMPFMAFSNFLRGVDLFTVFFVLFYLFLVVCVANMLAIFLACVPTSKPFKILIGLFGVFGSFWIIGPSLAFSFMFMRSGIGAMMIERNFWIGTLTAVAIGAALMGLFYVLSVALISPLSSNRALPVRIYVTVIWFLGGLLALGWIAKTGDSNRIYAWTYPISWLLFCALLVVIGNSDSISQRVRRTIPQSPMKRAAAFLFFNGAAGGLVWVGILTAATLCLTNVIVHHLPKLPIAGENRPWLVAVAAYIFDYALTALFIQRKFFPRTPPKVTGLFAIALAAAWALAPSIILFFSNQLTWKSFEGLELGNVFNVIAMSDNDKVVYHIFFAFGWLAVAILLNAKWFVKQARNFCPPAANAPPVIQ